VTWLGRTEALALAAQGAKVVVNDMGGGKIEGLYSRRTQVELSFNFFNHRKVPIESYVEFYKWRLI
jgi:hypothetical protein